MGFDSIVFITVISYICAVISLVVVFVLASLLTDYTFGRLSSVFRDISKAEMAVCLILLLFLSSFVTYSFCVSRVFWGTNLFYDVVYTSDTPVMIRENVYLNLYHTSNDIKQPLFAAFVAPFVGFGYVLSLPLERISGIFTPLFMNYIQLIMLVAANYLLAKLLPVGKSGRICFMILSSVTYCELLSAIMMEQYVIVYFWLIFALYFYMENKEKSIIDFIAVSGTLVTNFVLTPLLNESYARNKRKECVNRIAKAMLFYIALFFAFGRTDRIIYFVESVRFMIKFSVGKSFSVRVRQFLSFIASCFTPPDTVVTYKYGWGSHYYSLQLSNVSMYHFSVIGAVLFALCVVSLALNRKKKTVIAVNRRMYKIHVMNSRETINYILENKCSVSRFGDGEFDLLMENKNLRFQKMDHDLKQKLYDVLKNAPEDCLVCVPDVFESLDIYNNRARNFWDEWFFKNGNKRAVYKILRKSRDKAYRFGNTQFTRPYIDYPDDGNAREIFSLIKNLWNNKDILIVEGAKSRLGVNNDLLDNAASIQRILVPPVNAFDRYAEILSETEKAAGNRLILLAIGPTATVLASDLCRHGFRAIDIGHMDIEYEWYLRKAEERIRIPGKFTNEVKDGNLVEICDDTVYREQIIHVIK